MNLKCDAGTQVDSNLTCEAYMQTHDAVTTSDIATTTDNLTSEIGIQVDCNLTCEASTQTPNDNKQPGIRTDSGAAEKEKEQMKTKIAELEKFVEYQDRHIREQNAINEGATKKK